MRTRPTSMAAAVILAIAMMAAGGTTIAQGALAPLGLTEAAARNFLLNEATSTSTNRRAPIVETGRRAFYKLPAAARGPAATALFAWAQTYVGSPAFKTTYANHRRDVLGPDERPGQPSVDDQVQKAIDEMKTGIAQAREMAAKLPPADAARVLRSVEEQEARITSGEVEKMLRVGLGAERAERVERDAAAATADAERYPADPTVIFRRRLRQFLDATADVNFSARTLSLTGGPDGIEFVDKSDRQRSWMWQEAVIAGPEATAAARAAAQAWLKEIEP